MHYLGVIDMYRSLLFAGFLAITTGAAPANDSNNRIPYNKEVTVKVGESVILTGWRGECGARPKNVDRKRTRATKLGVLSNGKWGVTKSRKCGGWTPAVEIIFTAKKKGRETVKTAGDTFSVTVR